MRTISLSLENQLLSAAWRQFIEDEVAAAKPSDPFNFISLLISQWVVKEIVVESEEIDGCTARLSGRVVWHYLSGMQQDISYHVEAEISDTSGKGDFAKFVVRNDVASRIVTGTKENSKI